MTYALVIVEGPRLDEGHDVQTRWSGFLRATENRTTSSLTVQRLGGNSWLIPLQSDLRTLGDLVEDARKHHFPCRVMFSDAEPTFHVS